MTIILDRQQQGLIEGKVTRVIEPYDSFSLVEATDEQIKALKQEGFKVVLRDEPQSIALGAFKIDTARPRFSESSAILPHPAYEHMRQPGPGRHHYIVQFIGPIKEEWKQEISQLGGKIGDPLPSHSYIIEMDGQTRDRILGLSFVRWVGHYDSAYRIEPGLLAEVKTEEESLARSMSGAEIEDQREAPSLSKKAPPVQNVFLVSFQSPENLEQAVQTINALGAAVVSTSEDGRTATVSFPLEAYGIDDKIRQLALIHGVLNIEALRMRQVFNNIAARIITGLDSGAQLNLPLSGEDEIVAVADTGLDTGDPENIHQDFRGRIMGITSWPVNPSLEARVTNLGADDGPSDVDSGHGTHVAGSVLGDGASSSNEGTKMIRGLAHKSKLFFQAVEQKMAWRYDFMRRKYGVYALGGLPDDLTTLFQQAYDAGARIHTNSWGGGNFGAYDIESRDVDRFVWEHKDMVVLFAAGNDGFDRDRDGKVDLESLTPPGTAKNCICVGASENFRSDFDGTYRDIAPLEFPRDPIRSDRVADNPDDVAAFSGRGPCIDGRFKPDVLAPGTAILSTRSSECEPEEGMSFNDFYMYLHGTSMATPLAAGAVALIREHLRKTASDIPSAALIRAALIHSSIRRNYRFSLFNPGSELWDPEQGWGHVDLRAFFKSQPGWGMEFRDVKDGLSTGQSWTDSLVVTGQDHPLKITLAWTDYPGVADNYPNLINNLDLMVTAPDGRDFHGNLFSPPFDARFDATNNVESVMIQNPLSGRYKIMVIASEVREGPQDFALVYSGGLGAVVPRSAGHLC